MKAPNDEQRLRNELQLLRGALGSESMLHELFQSFQEADPRNRGSLSKTECVQATENGIPAAHLYKVCVAHRVKPCICHSRDVPMILSEFVPSKYRKTMYVPDLFVQILSPTFLHSADGALCVCAYVTQGC